MNNKVMAAFAAIVMAIVGFTVVVADDASANNLETIKATVGQTESITIAINEGNYTQYDYHLVWTVDVGEDTDNIVGEYTTYKIDGNDNLTPNVYAGKSFDVTSCTIGVKKAPEVSGETRVGYYNIEIYGKEPTTTSVEFTLNASITVKIGDETKFIEDFATYSGSIDVYAAGAAFIVAVNGPAAVGVYFEKAVSAKGYDNSNYYWYAVGLPEGLTMGSNGTISGIPTVAYESGKTFSVFATDKAGNVFHCDSVTLTVNSKVDVGISYELEGDEYKADAGSYIVYVGKEIKLNVFETGSDPHEMLEGATVSIINTSTVVSDGNYSGYQPVSGNAGVFTFTPSGSGAFLVKINNGSDSVSFMLYVIAEAVEIEPEIVIEGN